MSSKLTLSLLAALTISAAGGVARANTTSTSTDEALALAGTVTSRQSVDDPGEVNARITSTDEARAEAGRSAPASIDPSFRVLIARDADEGRAATVAGHQDSADKESFALKPAGTESAERRN